MNHAQRDQVSKILAQLSTHCFVGGSDDHTLDLIKQAQAIVDAPMESYLLVSPERLRRVDVKPTPMDVHHTMNASAQAYDASRYALAVKDNSEDFYLTPAQGIDLDHLERTWAHRDWAERARKRMVTVVLSILVAVALIAAALSGDSGPSTEQPTTKVEDTVRAKLPTRSQGVGPRHRYDPNEVLPVSR